MEKVKKEMARLARIMLNISSRNGKREDISSSMQNRNTNTYFRESFKHFDLVLLWPCRWLRKHFPKIPSFWNENTSRSAKRKTSGRTNPVGHPEWEICIGKAQNNGQFRWETDIENMPWRGSLFDMNQWINSANTSVKLGTTHSHKVVLQKQLRQNESSWTPSMKDQFRKGSK